MWDIETYRKALRFASLAYQKIPGSERPYLEHLVTVCSETMNAILQKPQDLAINLAIQTALLHDCIEDTQVTVEDIERTFGTQVAQNVLALTKDKNLPTKEAQMKDSLARILKQDTTARMVKMADRICNLQAPPAHWSKEKCVFYQQEAKLILNTLGGVHSLIEERLAYKIEEYSHFLA